MRIPLIAGNWKMNTTVSEAKDLVRTMVDNNLGSFGNVEKVVCPPFISLTAVREIINGTSIKLGAQNMYFKEKGAYTGEVSPSMLAGLCLSLLIPVYLIFAAELAVGERVGTAVGVMWGFAMAMGAVAPLLVGYLRDAFPDFHMAFMSLVIIALIGVIMSCFLPGQTRNV